MKISLNWSHEVTSWNFHVIFNDIFIFRIDLNVCFQLVPFSNKKYYRAKDEPYNNVNIKSNSLTLSFSNFLMFKSMLKQGLIVYKIATHFDIVCTHLLNQLYLIYKIWLRFFGKWEIIFSFICWMNIAKAI